MSFFTDIGNYVYEAACSVKDTVVEYIAGESSDDKKVKKKPNSINKVSNPGTNTDEFIKNAATSAKQSGQNEETANPVFVSMKNKCFECGADYTKIKQLLSQKGIIIDFLSNEEKNKQYNFIMEGLDNIIKMRKEGRFNPNTDINAWIAYGVELSLSINAFGVDENVEKYVNKHSNKYVKNIQNAKTEKETFKIAEEELEDVTNEYAELIDDVIGKNDNLFDKFINLFKKKKSDAEKEVEIRKLQEERDFVLKRMHLNAVAVTNDNGKLKALARGLDSDDLAHGLEVAGKTRKGKDAQTAFFDSVSVQDLVMMSDSYNESYSKNPKHILFGKCGKSMSFDELSNQQAQLCGYSCSMGGSKGENSSNGASGSIGRRQVSPQSVANAASVVSAGKSAEGLKTSENDIVKIRELVENSNDQYKKDLTRALHSGIGAGALVNSNLSDEEKVEFMNKWDSDARKFGSSYEQVKAGCKAMIREYIQKYGKNNPELVRHLEALEKKIDEIIAKKDREDNIRNKEAEKEEKEIKAEKKRLETVKKQKVKIKKESQSNESYVYTNPIESESIGDEDVNKSESKVVSVPITNKKSGNKRIKYNHQILQKGVTNQSQTTSAIVQVALESGYNSVPAGTERLKVTLTNPVLRQLYLNKTPEDLKSIQSVNEILPTLNLCPTSVRIFAVEHINPRIKDELIEALKKTSSQDFTIIIDARKTKEEKEVEEKENAAA